MLNPEQYVSRIAGLLDTGARNPGTSQDKLKELLRQLWRDYFPDCETISEEEANRRWHPFVKAAGKYPNCNEIIEALEWPASGGGPLIQWR